MAIYKFILEEDTFIQTNIIGREFINEWVTLDEYGLMKVKKGYAWDGCSPKVNFIDLTLGTPDGKTIEHKNGKFRPITYYGSLGHDVIYQFKDIIPITRKEADEEFYSKLLEVDFSFSWLYYKVVRCFGWVYGSNW